MLARALAYTRRALPMSCAPVFAVQRQGTMMMASDVLDEPHRSSLLRYDLSSSLYLYTHVGKRIPSWLLIACEHSGNGFVWILGVLALLLLPGVAPWLRSLAITLELGFLLDLAIVGAVKLLVKRARPAYAEREYHATIIADKYSFPSGHASRCIFIGMAFVVFRSICHPLVIGAAVVWAVCTSLSRVLLGRHYVGDVLTGAAIGVVIAALLSEVRPRAPQWAQTCVRARTISVPVRQAHAASSVGCRCVPAPALEAEGALVHAGALQHRASGHWRHLFAALANRSEMTVALRCSGL